MADLKKYAEEFVAFCNKNWEAIVKFVDKVWAFLKDTIFKDDSPFATTASK